MNELSIHTAQLPDTMPDLAKFVLIGREKLTAVRAEINAIKKVGLAKEVLEQKKTEAQEIAELVTLSEVKIGKMLREIPKATPNNNPFHENRLRSNLVKPVQNAPEEFPEREMKNPNNSTPKLQEDASVPEWEEQHEADVPLTETVVEEGEGEQPDWSAEPEVELPKTKTEIIKELGFSKDQVSQFQKMAEHEDVVQEAIAEARKNDDIVSRSLVLNMIKTQKKEQKRAERDEAIQAQIEKPKTSSHVDIYTTDKKYRVIYADPPWSYNDKQNTEMLGGAEKHYTTMPLTDICKLPIPADDNAVLFIWVTSPLLEDVFQVINAWGFKYKSSFIWDKVAHNMGHYNSVRHELLLIATKGSCTPDVPKLFDSVVSIERTEHSRKPQEFRDMIDTLYPVGNRIELFAREAPEGWDVWGNMA